MAFAAPVAAGAGRAAAGRAAGSRAAARRGAARKAPRRPATDATPAGVDLTGGHSADEVNEELQRRRQAAAEAKQQRAEEEPEPAAAAAEPAGSSRERPVFVRGMEPASSGAGFVLGVMAWAVVRAYIGNDGGPGGVANVRRLLRAKFLNQTGS